jgi:RNA polymerase sigma-70 factor (ECF subfamily)
MGLDHDALELDDYAVQLIRRKARQLVGRAGFTEHDREDIEQTLILDLLHRLPKFDSSRASRHTFTARIVEHGVARLIEHREAPMRDYRRCICSLNEWVESEDGDRVNRGDLVDQETYFANIGQPTMPVADRAAARVELQRVFAMLPPELRELWTRLSDGQTITEISQETGISRGVLYDRRNRLQEVAEKAGLRALLEDF